MSRMIRHAINTGEQTMQIHAIQTGVVRLEAGWVRGIGIVDRTPTKGEAYATCRRNTLSAAGSAARREPHPQRGARAIGVDAIAGRGSARAPGLSTHLTE